jgi:hypothetical protein
MKKDFDFKNAKRGVFANRGPSKVKKTMWLDMDVVAWLVSEAARTHSKYQTLINAALREKMLKSQSGEEENLLLTSVGELERLNQQINQRFEKVEAEILQIKKRA